MRSDISADDVVNGHREKTLTLLWRIIEKWLLGDEMMLKIIRNETEEVRDFAC